MRDESKAPTMAGSAASIDVQHPAIAPGPPQPPPALFWLYGLVTAGLFSIGVAAGNLFFAGNRSLVFPFEVAKAHCEQAFPDPFNDVSTLDGFTECLQRPAAISGLVVLAGGMLVLAGALALMVVLPLVDRWRSGWRHNQLRVPAAQQRFDRLCDESGLHDRSGLFGRRRPGLFVAGPPVRQAFTTALPGRRPIVVLPAAVALGHADSRRFDPIVRHELAHVLARDVTWVSALRGLLWVTVPAIIIGAIPDLFAVEAVNTPSATTFVEAIVLVAATATLAAALLRAREHEADRYTADAGSGSALAQLLASAATRTRRRALVRRILATHPDPAARISALPGSDSSRSEPRWSARGDLAQAMAFGFVAVTVMGAAYSLTALLNYSAQGWLPPVVASALGGILLGTGLTPSLYRRAVAARRTGQTVSWRRTVSGTAVGVVVGMFISPVVSLPGQTAFLPTSGRVATILAAALVAAAGAGAVALCAGLADVMSTAPAPRILRGMVYVAAAGATFAAFWPLASVASALSNPALLRTWLVYGMAAEHWPFVFATVPLAALILLTRRRRTSDDPHQPVPVADRDTTPAATVQAVIVAAVASVLASVASALHSHLVRPDTTDLAIRMHQERAWISALAGLIVLVIVGGRGGSRCLPLAILLAGAATLASGAVQFIDGALTVRSWSLINLRLSVATPGVWLAYLILLAAPILVLLPRTAPTASGVARNSAPSMPRISGRLRAAGTVGLAAAATVTAAALIIGLGLPLGYVPPTSGVEAAPRATVSAPAIPGVTGTIPAAPVQILTDDQAQAVAASVQATLPAFWKPRPSSPSSDTSVEPAACQPIATDAYIDALEPHQRAFGKAQFDTVSTVSRVVASALYVDVYAYDEKVPPSLFAEADAALAACPRLSTTLDGGGTLTIDFASRPAPAFGDRAWRIAEHLTARSGGTRITSTATYTIVSVGNHLITVLQLAVLEDLDENVANRALTTALATLHTMTG